MDLVSVGLPTYNRLPFLKTSLECILSQTYKELDIIISDNCSNDQTEEYCKSLAAKDSRIRYFRQKENVGAFENFNFILQQATGEYFFWIADDDLIENNFIETLLPPLVSGEAVLVGCDFKYINTQEKIDTIIKMDNLYPEKDWQKAQPKLFVPAKNWGQYHLIYGIFKLSVLNDIHEEFLQMAKYTLEILNGAIAAKGRVIVIPIPLRTFVMHGNNLEAEIEYEQNRLKLVFSRIVLRIAFVKTAYKYISNSSTKRRIIIYAFVDWLKSIPMEIYRILFIDKVRKFLGLYKSPKNI